MKRYFFPGFAIFLLAHPILKIFGLKTDHLCYVALFHGTFSRDVMPPVGFCKMLANEYNCTVILCNLHVILEALFLLFNASQCFPMPLNGSE